LGAAFVPVRKGGKLPGDVEVVKYEKEYGADVFEMQKEGVQKGQRCVVIE
jgi:adenine phosphoribosyltransferase